jgi:hypothetical protein
MAEICGSWVLQGSSHRKSNISARSTNPVVEIPAIAVPSSVTEAARIDFSRNINLSNRLRGRESLEPVREPVVFSVEPYTHWRKFHTLLHLLGVIGDNRLAYGGTTLCVAVQIYAVYLQAPRNWTL